MRFFSVKNAILAVCCLALIGCGDSDSNSTESKQNTYYAQLVEIMPVVSSLESAKLKGDENKAKEAQSKLQTLNIDEKISQDATAILQRAGQNGYSIILPDELAQDIESYTIMATLPRGVYNLGLIPNAKHFEFALSPSLNDNGSEWNWEADSLSRKQDEFIALLGKDKDSKIVFYDSGEYGLSPMGSAVVGIMWAKKLGYNNIYYLVGGFNAWKDLKLPISTEAPHCCQM